MKNIVWQKPDGSFAMAGLAPTVEDSTAHAAYLKSTGAVPVDWTVYSVDAAPPPQSLAEVKAAKLAQLEASRKLIEATPITGNQSGILFSISRPEKVNEFLMGGVQIALDSSSSAEFTMLDDNGVSVSYTKVLMGQIIQFMNAAKQPALARYATRKAAIEAALTVAAVDAVEVDLSKP